MIIYLDVIFLENLIMNLVIILSEATVLKAFHEFLRKIIASAIASFFYIMTLFYPKISFLQIVLSLLVIKISFNPQTIKLLIKETALFYFISFIFGGLSFTMMSIFNEGKVTILDGVLISDFSLFKVFLCGVLGAFLVAAFLKKKNKHVLKNMLIGFKGKKKRVRVLLDTGNLLKEPYTGKPVIIVEKAAIQDIFDEDTFKNFDEVLEGKRNLPIGMFIIPYKSIGNENGFLVGFRPEYIVLEDDEKIYVENAVIGICNENLSDNKLYSGIFGLDILEREALQV